MFTFPILKYSLIICFRALKPLLVSKEKKKEKKKRKKSEDFQKFGQRARGERETHQSPFSVSRVRTFSNPCRASFGSSSLRATKKKKKNDPGLKRRKKNRKV